MKIFLLFPFLLFAQSGAVRIQGEGISDYQIQATDPVTTPVTGKQYLYNSNNVLSTKDSLNNIQRVNKDYKNLLANFDIEQGLLPYVFTAGAVVLNTATQLEGLNSLDFDATALNDFIETPLITIPRILYGNSCMARINIRGGDANLQFQVVNGAGTIIHSGQFASAFTDSTPQHLVFACPTQAEVTATPALGQLKIKIVQSTATNAALATLDMFYLGELDAQTMAVTEGVEEWAGSALTASITNGTNLYFTTVTTVANPISKTGVITNDSTTRWRFTASMPVKADLSCANPQTNNGAYNITTILKNGTPVMGSGNGATNALQWPGSNAKWSGILNLGDTLACRYDSSVASLASSVTYLQFTAQPLSQIATVVPTTQTRAGLYGFKRFSNVGCTWSRNVASMGAFTPIAACSTGVTTLGFVVPDAVSNNQLPSVTLSKVSKGTTLLFNFNGTMNKPVTAPYACSYDLSLNGTPLNKNNFIVISSTSTGLGIPTLSFTYTATSDLINPKFELFVGPSIANLCEVYGTPANSLEITVTAFPDLSDSTEGITVNKMLPIVQGSETVSEVFLTTLGGATKATNNYFYGATISKNTISQTGTISNAAATGMVFTAKTKTQTSINCTGYSPTSVDDVSVMIVINGISIARYGETQGSAQNSGEYNGSFTTVLEPGDTIGCLMFGGATIGVAQGTISLTATSFGKPGVITSDAVVKNSQGTTARKWRTESCYITNNGTAAMASSSCSGWVQSVSRTALGQVTVTYIPGTFSTIPRCLGNPAMSASAPLTIPEGTNLIGSLVSFIRDAGAVFYDMNQTINCQGIE